MLLEICTPSLKSVNAAVAAGADRVELCEDLSVGGLTPALQLLEETIRTGIDTQVLIRPRAGNFVFSEQEISQMLDQIQMTKIAGADGVVVGALNADLSLNLSALKLMKAAAKGLQISFHKAIDEMPQPEAAIEQLIALGFDRILTSAGKTTALEGLPLLEHWQNKYGNDIEIMPGGGIRPENIDHFKNKGFASIHSAAIYQGEDHSDQTVIEALLSALKH